MDERLVSVGLDVGTTTTQLIVSELTVQNKASAFAVPEMEIIGRRVLYKSPVHFTPLLGIDRVDGSGIREIVSREYRNAGITREAVDTGAIIITGETSRRENARTVLDAVSRYAGEFVVATAGPHLESVLAAKGAGAVAFAERTGRRVLHMDIGGGTSNLALIEDGKIRATGCMNVGGRLLKLDETGRVEYVSPVLQGLTELKAGDRADQEQVEMIAGVLTQALEMAAGLREPTALLETLWTAESGAVWQIPEEGAVISFSGGVADCIDTQRQFLAYGDMGPELGKAIRRSRLCRGEYMLGQETIRATVIGAGCHSTQLSGSTVYHRNAGLPLKNLPVVTLSEAEQKADPVGILRKKLAGQDRDAVVALPGVQGTGYRDITALADVLTEAMEGRPVYVCLEADRAKALGHALALRCPADRPILCMDGLRLGSESYLDVGLPVGPALPVVIKTLILSH